MGRTAQVETRKIQRWLFRQENCNLSKEEYIKPINTACQRGRELLALLMETICATGIRASEVQYITVEQ